MMPFQIVSDSSCDLGESLAREKGICLVPFYVSFEKEQYQKEGRELEIPRFYQKMVENPQVFPRTSLPSVQDYADVFEPILQAGRDVLCLCLSANLSGSYNSARTAAEMLEEKYPGRSIRVVDTALVTLLQGMLVLEAARMRDAGLSLSEAADQVERLKKSGRIFFTIGGIGYLVHGGRVGKLVGLAASTLHLRPLVLWKDAELSAFGVGRSRRSSVKKVLEAARSYLQRLEFPLSRCRLVVGYGHDREEGIWFRDRLLEILRELGCAAEVGVFQIGATIGVHTGPDPLGVGVLEGFSESGAEPVPEE